MTLLAAVVAGFAAYGTIIPMQRQLTELVRQNQFMHYERLRARAIDLNEEILIVYRVTSDLTIVGDAFDLTGLGARERFDEAFVQLAEGVQLLVQARGKVWGDTTTQAIRNDFVESCLRAGIYLPMSKRAERLPLKQKAFAAGVLHHQRVEREIRLVGEQIASVEPDVLGTSNS